MSKDIFNDIRHIEGAFRHGANQRFRHTWPALDDEPLLDTPGWVYFFDLLHRAATQEHKLDQVQTLVLVGQEEYAVEQRIQDLLDFYAGLDPIFQAKVVHRSAYENVGSHFDPPVESYDFGVYSDSLLYVTEGSNGRFTKEARLVRHYDRFFEDLWDAGEGITLAESHNRTVSKRVSLSELVHGPRQPKI